MGKMEKVLSCFVAIGILMSVMPWVTVAQDVSHSIAESKHIQEQAAAKEFRSQVFKALPASDSETETIINVPFKAQVPPGTWSATNNCGQASSLMVFCYYKGTTPTEQGIKDIDDWLYSKYGDPINNYNGSITDTTKLEALAREYAKFPVSYKASGWDLNRLKQEINVNHPVIVAVTAGYLSNRGYSYSEGHFLVVKGYNSTHIICNDPGTSSGENKYYVNSEFSDAMSDQGGSVVVVIPTAGIDVYNGTGYVNWNKVHEAGYKFAFCKATQGIHYKDKLFLKNMKNGTDAGILMGAYHFAEPDLSLKGEDLKKMLKAKRNIFMRLLGIISDRVILDLL